MTTPAPQPAAAPQPAGPLTEAEDKQWASFAHFGGAIIVLALAWSWLALLAIVPALVIYLVFGKRGPRTLVESKEALNFQITAVGIFIVWAIITNIIVYGVSSSLAFGFDLTPYLVLASCSPCRVGDRHRRRRAVDHRRRQGERWRLLPYPFAIRLIK